MVNLSTSYLCDELRVLSGAVVLLRTDEVISSLSRSAKLLVSGSMLSPEATDVEKVATMIDVI